MSTARDLYNDIEADLLASINVVDFLMDRTDERGVIAGDALLGLHYVLADLRERLDIIKGECLNAIGPRPTA